MPPDRRAYSTSRRGFFRASAVIMIAPGVAIAQSSKAVRRIGVLEPEPPGILETPEWLSRQAKPLQELGWVEGKNLLVERRYANGQPEVLQALAEELVRAQVEIIVTAGTPATLAAKRATSTIPIVIRVVGDPVLVGLVASLARPGGNITGYSDAAPDVTAKRLSVLKELLPELQRVGVLWDARNPYIRAMRGQFDDICHSLRLKPVVVEIEAGQLSGSIEALARQNAEALLLDESVTAGHADAFVKAATRRGLPTMADESEIVRQDGALIAYSTTWAEQFRRRAEYIDRILRGARPRDLPIQQPTKFELLINLKTARALGITIPKELLVRADEVIQ